MISDSWLVVFVVAISYISVISFFFVFTFLLRKGLDSMIEDHKNSVEILSNVETNDTSCDMTEVFDGLEKNNIDISCNIKLD